ncbi:MAG: FkbM family methyltransferase [Pseudomonadota bacterium]
MIWEGSRLAARKLSRLAAGWLSRTSGLRPPGHYGEVREFLRATKALGFCPELIFDIGANRGNWTGVARRVFPSAKFVLFEPNGDLKRSCQRHLDAGAEWVEMGVSNHTGIEIFSVDKQDDTGSRVGEVDGAQIIQVQMTTIDAWIDDNDKIPDMIKIDAEGCDIKVIEGAAKAIGNTDVFFIEAAVAGGGDISSRNVLCLMEDYGYRFAGITERIFSPKNGLLWLAELAFVRRGSLIDRNANTWR